MRIILALLLVSCVAPSEAGIRTSYGEYNGTSTFDSRPLVFSSSNHGWAIMPYVSWDFGATTRHVATLGALHDLTHLFQTELARWAALNHPEPVVVIGPQLPPPDEEDGFSNAQQAGLIAAALAAMTGLAVTMRKVLLKIMRHTGTAEDDAELDIEPPEE